MTDNKAISIIIPTLNEAGNLEMLFERINDSLRAANIQYEIIIIDDHSTDATAAIAKQAAASYNVRFFTKQGHRGKAYSLLEGFKQASYDLICMIDGDLQYPPEAIAAMYHKMEYCNADIIITERIDNKTSLLRRISSNTYNLIFTKFLFGIEYDTQSGMKLFKKRVLRDLTLSPSPWSFDLEFIVKSLEQDFTIMSHPISFSKRYAGVAKVHMLSATYELSLAAVKLWRQTSTKRVRINYRNLQALERSLLIYIALCLSIISMSAVPHTYAEHDPSHSTTASILTTGQTLTNDAQQLIVSQTAPNIAVPLIQPSPIDTVQPQPITTPLAGDYSTKKSSANFSLTGLDQSQAVAASPWWVLAGQRKLQMPLSAPAPASNFKTSSAQQAEYYPTSELSMSKTKQYLHLASIVVGLGAISIVISVLIAVFNNMHSRFRRQIFST